MRGLRRCQKWKEPESCTRLICGLRGLNAAEKLPNMALKSPACSTLIGCAGAVAYSAPHLFDFVDSLLISRASRSRLRGPQPSQQTNSENRSDQIRRQIQAIHAATRPHGLQTLVHQTY